MCFQISTIEFAKIQAKVAEGMENGNKAMRMFQNELSLEDAQRIMDETQEGMEYLAELDRICGENLTEQDHHDTITTPSSHCHHTATAPSPRHHRTTNAPSLRHHRTITAQPTHHHCAITAPSPHNQHTITAPSPRHHRRTTMSCRIS